jgi:hypothetical protein
LPVRHRILRSFAAKPDRAKTARHGVAPSQDEKSAPEEKTAPQARRVPSLASWLYIVFCGAARRILPPAATRRRTRVGLRLETAAARGDIAPAWLIPPAIRRCRNTLRELRLDER